MNNRNSTLSRLLAKENITTITRNVQTAAFCPKTRTLILPAYSEKMSTDFVEYMIGHEVGHALFTDDPRVLDAFSNGSSIDKGILNVIEDNRIERLILSIYPGLIGVFKRAQKELFHDNFFNTGGKDFTDFTFLDRINLKSKIGDHFRVIFDNETENAIWDRVNAAMTSDEILEIYEDIKAYLKEMSKGNKKKTPRAGDDSADESSDDSADESSDDSADESSSDESDDSSSDESSDESDDSSSDESSDESDESSSDESSDESDDSSSDESDDSSSDDSSDELETDSSDECGCDSDLEDDLDGYAPRTVNDFNNKLKRYIDQEAVNEYHLDRDSMFESIIRHENWLPDEKITESEIARYECFNAKIKQRVNHLANEFNRRKSAWESSRARTAKSGTIDTSRLHEYRINDDIFLSRVETASAQSHGMIFLVDMSGSMIAHIQNVIEETIILSQFCQRVQIPFAVYSFTSNEKRVDQISPELNNTINPLGGVQLIELLNSHTMKAVDVKKAMTRILSIRGSNSKIFGMGSTPLIQSLIALREIHKVFRKETAVQKSTVMILTDGEADYGVCGRNRIKIAPNTYCDCSERNPTNTVSKLHEIIKDSAPNTTIITYRLLGNLDQVRFEARAKEIKAPATLKNRVRVFEKYNGADLAYFQKSNCSGYSAAEARRRRSLSEMSKIVVTDKDISNAKNKISRNIINKIVKGNVALAADKKIEKFFVEILTQVIS